MTAPDWTAIARLARERDAQARTADAKLVDVHQRVYGSQPEDVILLTPDENDDEWFV